MVGLVHLKQYSKKMLHCTLWLDIVINAASEVQLWFCGQELKRLAVKCSRGREGDIYNVAYACIV